MTLQEACRILGIPLGTEKKEIKKKYRKLMMQVHPDAGISSQDCYRYSAQEINSAYEALMKAEIACGGEKPHDGKRRAAKEKKNTVWDAPINMNAFVERDVLQYVEDYDGTVLGNYCIAKGKYLWKTDEDFPLFLLSLYKCSKELLDGVDERPHLDEIPLKRQQVQAELTYLLAQQFIDGSSLLEELAKKEETGSDGERIFYLPSMLELTDATEPQKAGEAIYPSKIRNHRLYLRNQAGKELGYLSFFDDRMYYIVIPLFEQKRVQVKFRTAEVNAEKRRKKAIRYQNLHLWVKMPEENKSRMPENLNLQIKALLDRYKENRV